MLVDPGKEYLQLIGLVIEEYKNLEGVDKDNYLLGMIQLCEGGGFVKTDKFFERYDSNKPGSVDPILGAHASYLRDLRHAQGKNGEGELEKSFGIVSHFERERMVH